ncbi:MAG: tetratricopeptide repeat protein, partial [Anaerolineae bacterium]
RLHGRLQNITGQTNVAERLEGLINDSQLPQAVQSAAAEAAANVSHRRYPVRYRHPATVLFQRVVIVLLAVLIFLIPLVTIRLESGATVLPDITFNASPLLRSDSPDFTPDLSQGVVALSLAPAPSPDVVYWLGGVVLLAELLLSTALGLLAIFKTSYARVQASARAHAVHLTPENIRIGDTALAWDAIDHCWQADIALVRETMPDNSTITLGMGDGRLTISGNTAWYPALKQHIARRLPETAVRADFSFSLLRSRLGMLYLGTIALIGVLAILGQLAARAIITDLPFVRYSLADLYPFLYLGLFVPPVVWFILKPMQIRRHTHPQSRAGLWLGALGLAWAVVRVLTLFRPWLTVPDIYIPLLIIILMVSAGYAMWHGRHPLRPDSPLPRWGRGVVMVVVTAVCLVMGLYIWREMGMYHFLVQGDAHRDAAQQVEDPAAQAKELAAAVDAYDWAIRLSQFRILGISAQTGARLPLGLPRPHRFSWVAALNGRAAMQSQLGNYKPAIDDYTRLLEVSDLKAQIYGSRAIAYQGWGTTASADEAGQVEVTRTLYDKALADFDQAIEINPENGRYYLWRGVAYHALSSDSREMQIRAWNDYEAALVVDGRLALDANGRT